MTRGVVRPLRTCLAGGMCQLLYVQWGHTLLCGPRTALLSPIPTQNAVFKDGQVKETPCGSLQTVALTRPAQIATREPLLDVASRDNHPTFASLSSFLAWMNNSTVCVVDPE